MFVDDAYQDGERRDAEAQPDKERKRPHLPVGDAELRPDGHREPDAEHERQHDAGDAGQDDEPSAGAEVRQVETYADDEHEQHEPELAEGVQQGEAVDREQLRR